MLARHRPFDRREPAKGRDAAAYSVCPITAGLSTVR